MYQIASLPYHFKKRLHSSLPFFILCLFTFSSSGLFAQKYKALLSGSNQAHSPLTPAKGEIWARLDGSTLKVWGEFSNLSGDFDASIANGSHIHSAYFGQNGSVEIILSADVDTDLRGGTYDSTKNEYSLSSSQIDALKGRMLYVNIHTKYSPAGEIRGQFVPEDAEVYYTKAYGSNHNHAVNTSAMGALLVDVIGTQVTVTGGFSSLESDFDANIAGGIHLHNGMAGTNGSVEVVLNATAATDLRSGVLTAANNTYTFTSSQLTSLKDRALYVNVHTKDQPAGEIRGQVIPHSHLIFRSFLSGTNQWPTVTSRAGGMTIVEVWDDQMAVSGSIWGLSSPADTALFGGAHIHTGYAGQAGGVDLILDIDYSSDLMSGIIKAADNTFQLSSSLQNKLWERMLYINIHSKKYAAGELRGQLLPLANYYINANLSGAQEPHNVLSKGGGKAVIEVNGNEVSLSGSFADLTGDFDAAIAGGSHLHNGLAGMAGGIAVSLDATVDTDLRGGVYEVENNSWVVSDGLLDSMRARWHYLNIHTKAVAAGELRGQLLPEATSYLFSKISGASEAPSTNSTGMGTAIVEVKGNWVGLSGSFSNLSSDFDANVAGGAHIHNALPGMNGAVWTLLNTDLDSDKKGGRFELMNNNWTLSSGAVDSMLMRMGYINIHTTGVASGELRGQIMNMANAYFTTNLSGMNQTEVVLTDAMGALKFELNGNMLTAVGSFSGLESAVATEIAGGMHIHSAKNGLNGDVEMVLNLELATDMKSAMLLADSNQFMVSDAQWTLIAENGTYVNLHSANHKPGVLRGQIQEDINWFPNADAAITAPLNGALLTVVGLGSTTVDIEWDMGTDNDNDDLTYIYHLSDKADFSDIKYWTYTGADLETELTFAMLEALMIDLGVAINGNVTLYQRVVSIDGSDHTASAANSMVLTRGLITGVKDALSLSNNQSSLYPTVASSQVQLAFSLNKAQTVTTTVYDVNGQEVLNTQKHLPTGNSVQSYQVNGLEPGNYWVSVKGSGFINTHKFIVLE